MEWCMAWNAAIKSLLHMRIRQEPVPSWISDDLARRSSLRDYAAELVGPIEGIKDRFLAPYCKHLLHAGTP
jgi:hypothetical protein